LAERYIVISFFENYTSLGQVVVRILHHHTFITPTLNSGNK
jgi:hypothetical protein